MFCSVCLGRDRSTGPHPPEHFGQQEAEGQGCPPQCQPLSGRSTSLSGTSADPAFMKGLGVPGYGRKHLNMDLDTWVLIPHLLLTHSVGQGLSLGPAE